MLPEKFNEETELHKNYHGKIRSNKYNNMGKDVLWPICIGLRYSVRTIQKVFSKSENDNQNAFNILKTEATKVFEKYNIPPESIQDKIIDGK